MEEEQLEWLLRSYDLDFLLEEHDIRPEYVLKLLVEEGLISLSDYFDDQPYYLFEDLEE